MPFSIITSPKNNAIVDKGDITVKWICTLDDKPIGIYIYNDYKITVTDLTTNEEVFYYSKDRAPEGFRSYTFPEGLFTSGHKYSISIEEIFNYQSYVSDQGQQIDTVSFTVQ